MCSFWTHTHQFYRIKTGDVRLYSSVFCRSGLICRSYIMTVERRTETPGGLHGKVKGKKMET